jgi:hypothetical protein
LAIVWAMAGEAGPAPAFTLEYEIQPPDVRELIVGTRGMRWKLVSAVAATIGWGLIAASFTAITIALDHTSVVKDSTGAPGWMYAVDFVLWVATAAFARAAWRRSAGRLARVALQQNPEWQGRTRDQVEIGGLRSISANGTEVFYPWATIDRVRETTHAFQLLDHNGHVRGVLPKRGLVTPDLLPALRTFLNHALGGQPPAVPANTTADGHS